MGQICDLSSDVATSWFFQMIEEMEDSRSGQKLRQDLLPYRSVIWLRYPVKLVANLRGLVAIDRFVRTQDGEIGIEKYLRVRIVAGVVRFRLEDERSDQATIWNGKLLAQSPGKFGAAFLVVRDFAVVNHVVGQAASLTAFMFRA